MTSTISRLFQDYEAREAASEAAWHPTWCRRDFICEGHHISDEAALPTTDGGTIYLTSVLDQGQPLVDVMIVDPGDETTTITITAAVARQLADALTEAVARHQTIAA